MVHTNPINEVEVLIRIVTLVLGTWFVARGLYTFTKPDAPESLGVLILPAAVLCVIMWAILLLGQVLVLTLACIPLGAPQAASDGRG